MIISIQYEVFNYLAKNEPKHCKNISDSEDANNDLKQLNRKQQV